jgi:hypothetical protein
MRRLVAEMLLGLCLIAGMSAILEPAVAVPPVKDQSRILPEDEAPDTVLRDPVEIAPLAPLEPEDPAKADRLEPSDETVPHTTIAPRDIPVVVTVELTADLARRALDAYAEVLDKYSDEELAGYETLEDFVAGSEAGKRLEADIIKFGFANVTEWNNAIMAVGFAYNAVVDDSEEGIREQIEEIRAAPDIAEDERTRLIASLNALLPSDGNKTILRQLLNDPIYREKLKLFAQDE